MDSFLNNDFLGITTYKQVLLILHLIGLALGAGAALFSDFLFTHILHDKTIDKTEFGILKLTSKVVWIGLSVLFATGLIIFLGDTERLLDTPKFLAKMTIIFALFLNGLAFHFYQIPALSKFVGKNLAKSQDFKQNYATTFFVGGAVSGVSWVAALVLGALDGIDMSYLQIMIIYLGAMIVSCGAAIGLKNRILS